MKLYDISFSLTYVLAALSMVSIIFYVYLLVKAYLIKYPFVKTVPIIGGLFLAFADYEIFRLYINGTYRKGHILYLFIKNLDKTGSIPAWVIAAISGILVIVAVIGFLSINKADKNKLTPFSIQEGMDNLPDGIIYSTPDGIPLLVNRTMQLLCKTAFKTAVFDVVALEKRYRSGDFADGCTLVKLGGISFLELPDKTVWRLVKNEITVDNKAVFEIIAYNATEFYNKSLELEKRNAQLNKVNEGLKVYSRDINKIIREKEILAAKVELHNNLGSALLMLRAYLSENETSRAELLEIWSLTIAVLRREAEAPTSVNELDILKNAASAVGVELKLEGELPKNQRFSELMVLAVHECITNTVKHAGGSELYVKIYKDANKSVARFTNNGAPPQGEISEKGGLKNLRKKAEACGASMFIKSLPAYELKLVFPCEI